jgi:hypothetical protein
LIVCGLVLMSLFVVTAAPTATACDGGPACIDPGHVAGCLLQGAGGKPCQPLPLE